MKKTRSPLDKFVFDFCKILKKEGIKYVIVSGYVAIVFGRSRNTEDIDILVERIDFEKFKGLWKTLSKRYECMNTSNVKEAYFEYLSKKTSIRFFERGKFIPNFEFKFIKTNEDEFTLNNSIELKINNFKIYISPIELQIAYKLKLGSDKDVDDAIHLFELFKVHLNREKLKGWIRYFEISREIVEQLE